MKRAMLVLVLLAGCGYREEVATLPDETVFLQRLWSGIFDGPGGVPRVQWEEGDRLDPECGGKGWLAGDGIHCVDGATFFPGLVLVARWPGGQLWQLSLAHELAHARDLAWGSDGDPGHQSAAFQPGGDVWRGEVWLRQETEQGRVPAGMLLPPEHQASLRVAGRRADHLGHEAALALCAGRGRVRVGSDGDRPGR